MIFLIPSQNVQGVFNLKERIHGKVDGSVTVFSALSFFLIATFLFALLDAGRCFLLESYADMTSELAVESLEAEYQPVLWEDFHLLCLDGAGGGETFSIEYPQGVLKNRIDRNLNVENLYGNMLALRGQAATIEDYQLLTDGEGAVFFDRIADYMKGHFPIEAARGLRGQYEWGESVERENALEESIENAQDAITEARAAQEKEMDSQDETEVSEKVQNPLELALELRKNSLLELVLEEPEKVSSKAVEISGTLLNRNCRRGTARAEVSPGWYEKVLVLEYMGQYYGSYTQQTENQSLSYETEYVLCGKGRDSENLEEAVKRVVAQREAANVAYLLQDDGKRKEAELLAAALGGFSGNPLVIKAVEIGIIGAWAYMESILDVRALLQGDKIALIKNSGQWTLDAVNLEEGFSRTAKAKNCEDGLSYEDYLKMLLYGREKKILSYRMMDVMEWHMQQNPRQQYCRMDAMICRMSCRMEYEAETIFFHGKVLKNTCIKEFAYD